MKIDDDEDAEDVGDYEELRNQLISPDDRDSK